MLLFKKLYEIATIAVIIIGSG